MVIPESGAGYSRVTHPFATDPQEQAPVSPFDLHVLSTPPAFVLSQDQTLRKCLLAPQRPRSSGNRHHEAVRPPLTKGGPSEPDHPRHSGRGRNYLGIAKK